MNAVVGLFLLVVLLSVIALICIAAVSRPRAGQSRGHGSTPAAYDPVASASYNLFSNSGASVSDGSSATTHNHLPGHSHSHPHTLDHTSHHHHVGDPAWDTSHGSSGSFDSGSFGGDGGGGDCGGGGGGGD